MKNYGARQVGKSIAEIDYLTVQNMHVLPIEVKAGTQGGMKSLWMFMREKHLTEAARCSLENFGSFEYIDKEDNNTVRHVRICPLYAISSLFPALPEGKGALLPSFQGVGSRLWASVIE